MKPVLHITRSLWNETTHGLAKRGSNLRESACIWAGTRDEKTWKVTEIVYLDDLHGTKSTRRYHSTSREALSQLFEILRSKKLQIIADVHTHPSIWVDMSLLDMENPIEHRIGLLAFIIPNLAKPPVIIEKLGVHEYIGQCKWNRLSQNEIHERFIIE